MAGFHERLKRIAEQASPRTAIFFALAFALLVVWLILAAFGAGK